MGLQGEIWKQTNLKKDKAPQSRVFEAAESRILPGVSKVKHSTPTQHGGLSHVTGRDEHDQTFAFSEILSDSHVPLWFR